MARTIKWICRYCVTRLEVVSGPYKPSYFVYCPKCGSRGPSDKFSSDRAIQRYIGVPLNPKAFPHGGVIPKLKPGDRVDVHSINPCRKTVFSGHSMIVQSTSNDLPKSLKDKIK